MQRTQVSGYGQRSWPQGEAVVLPNQRQRRLTQSAAGSARKGADCWQRLASLGVCRLGEARAGPAGGLPPKRGWRTQIFKKTRSYPQSISVYFFLVYLFSCF
ncbi:MAG: hypothetical protein AN488_20365 [Anabaena sp. WA113]|nr:MAG: hypothetical protein AN488_20365 [Anabaena sp. WA113]